MMEWFKKGKTGRFEDEMWSTSLNILKSKLQTWFEQKFGHNKFILLDEAPNKWNYKIEEVRDFVFSGSHLLRFLELGNLNFEKIKIWVLSSSVKRVMTNIYGIPEKYIGVIPRYELFDLNSKYKEAKELNFVYAGRITPSKNIHHLICFIAELKKYREASLHIFGNFEQQPDPFLGRFESGNYQELIWNLIKDLGLSECITIHQDQGPDEWIKNIGPSSIGVSFSAFYGEDFGVSLAQLQESGHRIFCTDWGGHQDLSGEILKFPINLIPELETPQVFWKDYAQELAKFYVENGFKYIEVNNINHDAQEILPREIEEIRKKLLSRYNPEAQWIFREGLSFFFDTVKGTELKKRMGHELSQQNIEEVFIIAEDWLQKEINNPSLLQRLREELHHRRKIHFLRHNQVYEKSIIYQIISAKKIILRLEKTEVQKCQEFLVNTLGIELGIITIL